MKRLFGKALFRAVFFTASAFGFFALFNWTGITDYSQASLQFWIGLAAVMTLLNMISIPLDERWAKRRDHAKGMKDRNLQ